MKTHVVKTTPDASLAEAVDLMDIYQVDSMPVVDAEGLLRGHIAELDILRTIYETTPGKGVAGSDGSAFDVALLLPEAAGIRVGDVMQREFAWISEDSDIMAIMRLFFVNGLSRIPVISHDGRVVGTLNRIDIFQALFEGQLPGHG